MNYTQTKNDAIIGKNSILILQVLNSIIKYLETKTRLIALGSKPIDF